MKEAGLSAADEIAAELGLHRATVYRWIRRWEEDGKLRDRPRSGVKRKTTPQDEQRIREHSWPFHTANNDTADLEGFLNEPAEKEALRKLQHKTPTTLC
ncbi:hypothetical protein Pmani_003428 [Petrolisthes manimaculis]|uniref:Transposase n=1 Tax=Petrolisthes manimaculis TaxID=1843537 RepID=A0AAE1QGQ8_9EUCA|nr:hypothetical protein Pmani_003428 [Petrolisthes manimaculis]